MLPTLSGRLWACFVRCMCRGSMLLFACGCMSLTRMMACCAVRRLVFCRAKSFVTQVNVAWNGLGTEGGQALADCLKTNTTITQVRRFVARPCVAHAVLLHCAAVLRCCASPGGVSVDRSHEQIVCQSCGSEFGCQPYLGVFGRVLFDVCVAGRCFCVNVDVRD